MTDRIRILALDHMSAQDRSELIRRGGADFAWRVIPYHRLRDGANRILPAEVQGGLSQFARPDFERERRAHAKWLRGEVRRLYREWPFDVLLLPSDTFYYVRGIQNACHELGVPVVVSQKETTITDPTLAIFARDVGAYAPFESDRMAVCSERHKSFWLRAGANSELIDVTGQPRFDFYARPHDDLAWSSVSLPPHPRTVLFLSYEQDAYLVDIGWKGAGWHDVRSETEQCLFDAVQAGWRVVVKLHPLQDEEREHKALAERAPGLGTDVVLAPSTADTRQLIVLADAVVGFQTTALYEAMLAGKPVAYTAWGASYQRAQDEMIPFGERPDLLDIIGSPEELTCWLRQPALPDVAVARRRLEYAEAMLGQIDGRASERTLAVIRSTVCEWADRRRSSTSRRALGLTARPAAALTIAATTLSTVVIRAGISGGSLLPRRPRERIGVSLGFRLERAGEQLRIARQTLERRV
jgi:hypothetical protein